MIRYLGGKNRISKEIALAIGRSVDFEPFCGGGNVTAEINPRVAFDIDADVINLFNAVKNGYDPPETITEDRYTWLREHAPHSCEGVFAAFAASYSGKKWGGYARDPNSDRNYCAPIAKRIKIVRTLRTSFETRSYNAALYPYESVVYCDPPYADTTGYKSGTFDSVAFWDWVLSISDRRHVFISERSNPLGLAVVWSKEIGRTQSGESGKSERVRELLMYCGPGL